MNNIIRKVSLSKIVFQLILIVFISILSSAAYSAFEQEVLFTDDNGDFYVTVPADGTIKMGSDSSDIVVPVGTSAKIEFIIPPGTDQYHLTAQEVSSWSGQQGDMKYAVSLSNYASANDYPLVTSTALSVIFLFDQTGVGALTTTVSNLPRRGYLIVKNESGQPWTSFYINVSMRVSNSAVYNAWINDGGATPDVPSAPTNLASSAVSKDSVTLNWSNTADNATNIRIKRNGVTIVNTLSVSTTSYVNNTGLSAGTTYSYEVCAYNNDGESCSTPLSVTTASLQAPAAPSGLNTSSLDKTSLTLNWTDNSGNEDGFRVYSNGVKLGNDLSAGTTSMGYSGFISGSTYLFKVCAYNVDGEVCSAVLSVTMPTIQLPAAPDNFVASNITVNSLDLSWTDNATNEDGYRVKRFGAIIQDSMASNSQSYSDSGLTLGTTYGYQVCAYNGDGETCSATLYVATLNIQKPTNLSVSDISDDSLTLHWTDNEANEDGYRIKNESGVIENNSPAVAGTGQILDYEVTGLSASESHTYYICAFNALGEACESIVAATLASKKPTNLSAIEVNTSSLKLSWTDNSNDEDAYRVYKDAVQVGSDLPSGTVVSLAITGLSINTSYDFKVCAVKGVDEVCSDVSAIKTAGLSIPTGLTASSITKNSLTLNWTDNTSDETAYQIKRNNVTLTPDLAANSQTHAETGLNASTTYSYQVCAINADGREGCSFPLSVTTSALQLPAAPSNFSYTADTTSIVLNWKDNATDETSYRIERDSSTVGTPSADAVTYTDTGLTAEQQYTYRICAVNSDGETCSYSLNITTTPLQPPSAPTGITTSNITETSVTLSWTDNATTETGYRVKRNNTTIIDALGVDTVTYDDNTLHPGMVYDFEVCAYNTAGESCGSAPRMTSAGDPLSLAPIYYLLFD